MATTKKKKTKRTTKKKAANPAFEFLINFMKRRPAASYADAAAASKAAGHKVFPIMWGRAQVLLGRAKPKKKAGRKAAPRQAASGRKSVGRPRGRKPAAARGSVAIPVDDAAVPQMSALVEALNGGGKAMLRYDGKSWILTVE